MSGNSTGVDDTSHENFLDVAPLVTLIAFSLFFLLSALAVALLERLFAAKDSAKPAVLAVPATKGERYGYPAAATARRLCRMGFTSSALPVLVGVGVYLSGDITRVEMARALVAFHAWPFVFLYLVLALHLAAAWGASWGANRAMRALVPPMVEAITARDVALGGAARAQHVLVVTAGRGAFPLAIARAIDAKHNVIVTDPGDPAPFLRNVAAARLSNTDPVEGDVSLARGVFLPLPCTEGTLSVAMLTPTTWIEYGPCPSLLFAECFRSLRPGGYIVAFAPLATRGDVCDAFRAAGFEAGVKSRFHSMLPFPVSSIVARKPDPEGDTALGNVMEDPEAAAIAAAAPRSPVKRKARSASTMLKDTLLGPRDRTPESVRPGTAAGVAAVPEQADAVVPDVALVRDGDVLDTTMSVTGELGAGGDDSAIGELLDPDVARFAVRGPEELTGLARYVSGPTAALAVTVAVAGVLEYLAFRFWTEADWPDRVIPENRLNSGVTGSFGAVVLFAAIEIWAGHVAMKGSRKSSFSKTAKALIISIPVILVLQILAWVPTLLWDLFGFDHDSADTQRLGNSIISTVLFLAVLNVVINHSRRKHAQVGR